MATRGFSGRPPPKDVAARLPPGQYRTDDFPVLAMGPTPHVELASWKFTLSSGPKPLASWTWSEFERLPRIRWRGDIHCVTKWSKFDTQWEGVGIDDLFAAAGVTSPPPYALALSYDGYDTNVPVADLSGGRAMIATRFEGNGASRRARRSRAAARAAPLFLEEREVAEGAAPDAEK